MTNLESIRESERISHEEVFSKSVLFEKGSWLYKPVKTVLDILPLFSDYKNFAVLDLGCGVGRNSIPIAQFCQDKQGRVDCVDILEIAIDKLIKYGEDYGVSHVINGIVSPIDEFEISKDSYDFILAVSALEHVDSAESFRFKLNQIRDGLKANGIVCLIVNSDVVEKNKESGELIAPQFEVNLGTEQMLDMLETTFEGWENLKSSVVKQQYDIPRGDIVADLTSNVVTYVTRKR